MSEFFDQYKRPEWQKRRLEVMQAAGFACQDCDSKEKPLHVHHALYIRDREVWDYPDTMLRCLCEDCHGLRHDLMRMARHMMGNLHPDLLQQAIGYIEGLMLLQGVSKHIQLGVEVRAARGIADVFGIRSPDGPHMLVRAEDENGRLTMAGVDEAQNADADFQERLYASILADKVAQGE